MLIVRVLLTKGFKNPSLMNVHTFKRKALPSMESSMVCIYLQSSVMLQRVPL